MVGGGVVIGGFATFGQYYIPFRRRLAQRGVAVSIMSPGPLGLNIWPISVFQRYAEKILADPSVTVFIGHSLGGLQAIWLADQMPNVRRVIAIASPVHGFPWPSYETSVRALLGASDDFMAKFREETVPRVAPRLTTIASPADDIAPPTLCTVDGAENHLFDGLDHILMPFAEPVLSLITHEVRA
jgi:pimeloyl-ACP methyl ester carboxylesterase